MTEGPSRDQRRRLGKPAGCLLWLLALVVLLLLLSALFGGFQKGTKVSQSAPARDTAIVKLAVPCRQTCKADCGER